MPTHHLQYSIDDVPPIHVTLLLGFQQFLTMMGGTIAMPVIIAEASCVGPDLVGRAQIMGTLMFVNGLSTLMQIYFGVRLPIIQGPSFTYVVPMIAMTHLAGRECPTAEDYATWKIFPGSNQHRSIWMSRLLEIQAAMLLAGVLEAVIGSLGLVSLLLRYVGPLTIAPTMALIALTLVGDVVSKYAATFWPLSLLAMCLVIMCTLYLHCVSVPVPTVSLSALWKERKFKYQLVWLRIFALFPILMSICISWGIYAILAFANALPQGLVSHGSNSTAGLPDIYLSQMSAAPWFQFPYPGQWGLPRINVALTIGMFAAVLTSIVESIGDYFVCARMCGVSTPPGHAINRGITVEGFSCILAGAFGSGPGVTSYSENVGAIGITGVASRRVVCVAAIILMLLGCFTKAAMFFVLIPEPIIGGVLIAILSLCAAVGFSYLQFVDMKLTRNLLIFGLAIFLGLGIPNWVRKNHDVINSGSEIFDQLVIVLLSTGIFVGGFVGFFLDNTVPKDGPSKKGLEMFGPEPETSDKTYDLPWKLGDYVRRVEFFRYVPICPSFEAATLTSWLRSLFRRRRPPAGSNADSDSGVADGGAVTSGVVVETATKSSDLPSVGTINEAFDHASISRTVSQASLTLSFSGISITPRMVPLASSADEKWTDL